MASICRRLLIRLKQGELLDACNKRCYSKFGPTELKGRSSTAQKWLTRQMKDPYVKLARQEDYRCRSAFKLLEIDKKYDVFKPGQIVIDCGASPGSWTQAALDKITGRLRFSENQSKNKIVENKEECSKGFVIGIDLLEIQPIEGAIFLNKRDFTKPETHLEIKNLLQGQKADVIMSDMAPNATGFKFMDHKNSVEQVRSVIKFSLEVLKEGGTLVVKTFQGNELTKLEESLKMIFETVKLVKPHASRADSAEVYFLAKGFGIIASQ